MGESAAGHGAEFAMTPFAPNQRKRAIAALLVVTSVWGATFIWMKQALNALQPEIEAYGSNRVVGVLVAARFAIAALVMVVFFPKAKINGEDVRDYLLKISDDIVDKAEEQETIWTELDKLSSSAHDIKGLDQKEVLPPQPSDFSTWFNTNNSIDFGLP